MGLEGHKHVGDWQALFGVNLRCHHLSWYTMEGEAKRDYPASILHQSAWWKDYSAVETYFARLGLLLSQGEPVCDVLVIHPVESVWAQIHPGWCNGLGPKADPIKKLETQFAELFHWLQGAQIDFDYGDEGILAEHASIDGEDFLVGQMRYKTILVGGCTTIRSTTLKLLERFAEVGGKVIFAGDIPEYVDALPSQAIVPLTEQTYKVGFRMTSLNVDGTRGREGMMDQSVKCRWHPAEIPRALGIESPYTWSVKSLRGENYHGYPNVFVQRRRLNAKQQVIVALNVDRENATGKVGLVTVPMGNAEEWNPLTGERIPARYDQNDPSRLVTDFPPGGLRVFIISQEEHHELPGPFTYSLDEPNALVLDTATWQLDGGEVHPATEILKIDQAVRRHFGLEVRGGEMVQPWYAEKFHGEPPVLGNLTLRFTFEVETLPDGPVTLAIERPDRAIVTVNGSGALKKVSGAPAGARNALAGARNAHGKVSDGGRGETGGGRGETIAWVDACFGLLEVPEGALRLGENVVTLTTEFRRDSELEALYLLGNFGVRLDGPKRTVIPLPETLAVGDICAQGLPFYTGGVTYQIDLPPGPRPAGESILELPQVGGACVRVNGQTIPWPPYTTTLTPFAARNERSAEGGGERCEPGDAVTVVLTRRNLFGPLHLVPKQQAAYGPSHWVTGGTNWSDNYQLYPSGLLAPPRIR
jgi:hypothetical protein